MIKTKYPITIEIDEKSFSVVVSEQMTSNQKDEFSSTKDKHTDSFTKKDSIQSELTLYQEEFTINKHILAHGSILDKVNVMFEQKTLNQDIFRLTKELSELDKTIVSLSKAIEELSEKRYDLLVGGADKASLKSEIQALGIDYEVLFAEFAKEIKESKEKK